jgi:hypothetical protein
VSLPRWTTGCPTIITAHILVRQTVEDWDLHQTSGQPTLSLIVLTIYGILDVLSAKPSDSIDFIKFKLSQKNRLPTEDMLLFFAGIIFGLSTLSLFAIGVVDQSVVYLLWDVRPYEHLFIFSHPDGDYYPLLVHPEETFRDVWERIQTQDGILVELQQLAFLDLVLDDDYQVSLYSTSLVVRTWLWTFRASPRFHWPSFLESRPIIMFVPKISLNSHCAWIFICGRLPGCIAQLHHFLLLSTCLCLFLKQCNRMSLHVFLQVQPFVAAGLRPRVHHPVSCTRWFTVVFL